MSSSEEREKESCSWGACPGGMLLNTVSRLSSDRRRQQRRQSFRVYGVLLVVAAVGIGGGYLLRLAPMDLPGGIACTECGQYLADYHAGELETKVAQQVRTHLDACDHCRQIYESKFSAERAQVTTSLAMSLPYRFDGSDFLR